MATRKPGAPFFREVGSSLVVAWKRIDMIFPESYFTDPPLAEDHGTVVESIAFFDVRAFETESSKPRTFAVRLPARMRLHYTSASTETDSEGDPMRVFSIGVDEVAVDDVNVVQSSDSVSAIFRIMAGARITGVSYTDMAGLFINGARLNGVKPGVTRFMMEALTSEMARWKDDLTVPLRVAMAAGKATENDAVFVKLKDLPRLNSVFTGIGFENIQLAVQSGVRKTASGEPQRESPMERLIKL